MIEHKDSKRLGKYRKYDGHLQHFAVLVPACCLWGPNASQSSLHWTGQKAGTRRKRLHENSIIFNLITSPSFFSHEMVVPPKVHQSSLGRAAFSQYRYQPDKSKPCAWLVSVFPTRPGQIALNTLGPIRLQRTGLSHKRQITSISKQKLFIGDQPRLHKMLGSVTLLEHEPELHDHFSKFRFLHVRDFVAPPDGAESLYSGVHSWDALHGAHLWRSCTRQGSCPGCFCQRTRYRRTNPHPVGWGGVGWGGVG